MSVKMMGLIWDADLPREEKYILLAYADHADHEGNNIYPGLKLIAWKTGYEPRQVRRVTKVLVDKKYLIFQYVSQWQTNCYKLDIAVIPTRPPYEWKKGGRPLEGEDILSSGLPKGEDIPAKGEDIAMSTNPSLNHQLTNEEEEVAKSASNIFQLYEQNIGMLSPLISDALLDAEKIYPATWFEAAMREAVSNNARSWKYVEAILKRWQRDGFGSDTRARKNGKDKSKTTEPGAFPAIREFMEKHNVKLD